jgi:hypothetical protein
MNRKILASLVMAIGLCAGSAGVSQVVNPQAQAPVAGQVSSPVPGLPAGTLMGTGTGRYVVQYRRGMGWHWRYLTRTRQRRRAYVIAAQVRTTGYHARVLNSGSGYGYGYRPYYGYNPYAYRRYGYRRSYGRRFGIWNSTPMLASAVNQSTQARRTGASTSSLNRTPTSTTGVVQSQAQARRRSQQIATGLKANPAYGIAAGRTRNASSNAAMIHAAHAVKAHQAVSRQARSMAAMHVAMPSMPRPHTMGQHAAVHHAAVHMGSFHGGGGGFHGGGGGGGGHHGGHR